jgi:hypothetical protein
VPKLGPDEDKLGDCQVGPSHSWQKFGLSDRPTWLP